MKLWRISQDVNTGYDTFDSAIVAAVDETAARSTYPSGDWPQKDWYPRLWANSPDQVEAVYIGEAKEGTEPGVILASFNAG